MPFFNSTSNVDGCIMYVALFPCNECAKIIIQAGIREVVYLSDKYAAENFTKAAKRLFNESSVSCRQLEIKRKPIIIDWK